MLISLAPFPSFPHSWTRAALRWNGPALVGLALGYLRMLAHQRLAMFGMHNV